LYQKETGTIILPAGAALLRQLSEKQGVVCCGGFDQIRRDTSPIQRHAASAREPETLGANAVKGKIQGMSFPPAPESAASSPAPRSGFFLVQISSPKARIFSTAGIKKAPPHLCARASVLSPGPA
jgi:hypothetical protein